MLLDDLRVLGVLWVRIVVGDSEEGDGCNVGLQSRRAVVLGASSSGTKKGGLSTLGPLTTAAGVVGVAEATDGAGEARHQP